MQVRILDRICVVFLFLILSTNISLANGKTADTQCPKPDDTHKYLGGLYGAVEFLPNPFIAGQKTMVINLSRKRCTDKTDTITTFGTCDAPDICHARYCVNLSGQKVLCMLPKEQSSGETADLVSDTPRLANGQDWKPIPDQSASDILLTAKPLSQQDVTLQPIPLGTDAKAADVTTPLNPYSPNQTKPTSFTESLDQSFARDNLMYSNAPNGSQKAVDELGGTSLSKTGVVRVDTVPLNSDTQSMQSALGPNPNSFTTAPAGQSNNSSQLSPSIPTTYNAPSTFSPPPRESPFSFSQFTQQYRQSTNVENRTIPWYQITYR
jgi:hypothetical protein